MNSRRKMPPSKIPTVINPVAITAMIIGTAGGRVSCHAKGSYTWDTWHIVWSWTLVPSSSTSVEPGDHAPWGSGEVPARRGKCAHLATLLSPLGAQLPAATGTHHLNVAGLLLTGLPFSSSAAPVPYILTSPSAYHASFLATVKRIDPDQLFVTSVTLEVATETPSSLGTPGDYARM